MTEPLTVCTVSFNSGPYLRQNRYLTEQLNPGADVRWIVAENSPKDSAARLLDDEPGFRIIEGAGPGHTPTYHHTLALRRCIDLADTRFVLVLDPDLFVVRPDWVRDVIGYMLARRLAILGVPWHPQSGKYRYFPAVHFSIFDTSLFDKSAIDFRPDYPNGVNDPEWPEGWKSDRTYFAISPVARVLARLPLLQHRCRYYTDTGSRLFKRYIGDRSLRFEILDPIFDAAQRRRQLSFPGLLLECLLPDALCYIPKYYNQRCHSPFLPTLIDASVPDEWEQFMWQGSPFCFHVRRNLNTGARSSMDEIDLTGRIVYTLVAQYSRSLRTMMPENW